MLKEYIVSYTDEGTEEFTSDCFICKAESKTHAIEQCENAYPNAFISDCYKTTEN